MELGFKFWTKREKTWLGRGACKRWGRSALVLLGALSLFLLTPAWADYPPSNNADGGNSAPPPGTEMNIESVGSMGSAAGAVVASSRGSSSSRGTVTFFLAVVLLLFGYSLYSNYGLTARIDKLEDLVRRNVGGSRERDELVPFSWNAVLRSLEGGMPFLPGLSFSRPGLMLLGVPGSDVSKVRELLRKALVNATHTVIQDPELMVLALTRHLSADSLGRDLLSLEAGKDWRTMSLEERQELLKDSGSVLERYEKSLFCLNDLVLTTEQIYATSQELLKDGDLGLILLDDCDVLACDKQEDLSGVLERLHVLASRSHVPVCFVVPESDVLWQRYRQDESFTAVGEFKLSGDDELSLAFSAFPGQAPSCRWRLDRLSGRFRCGDLEASSVSEGEHNPA